jgi:hypothetical protein
LGNPKQQKNLYKTTKKNQASKYSNPIILKYREVGFCFKKKTLENARVLRVLLPYF